MSIMMSLQGVQSFLLYFAAGLVAEALFVLAYMAITPHHEARLIESGNTAAAVSLAGAVIGFTLPVVSVIANSVSLLDMLVWCAVALVVQLAAFLLASLFLRGLARRIEDGNMAAATTTATVSLSIGLLNAASMTY
jgi:putative membrane protein